MMAHVGYIMYVMVEALAGSQGLVNSINSNKGLVLLQLACIALSLITTGSTYVKFSTIWEVLLTEICY